MKKLATKLTPAIKDWIEREFKNDFYKNQNENYFFHFPNLNNGIGYYYSSHLFINIEHGYTEVLESEFLAEFNTNLLQQIKPIETITIEEAEELLNFKYKIK